MPGELRYSAIPARSWRSRRSTTQQSNHCRNDEQNDRDEEDDLRNLHREACNTTKSQDRRDERDNQERESPSKHDDALLPMCSLRAPRSLNNALSEERFRRQTSAS